MTDLRKIFIEGANFGHFHLKREEISEHDQKIYELEAENRFPEGSIPQTLSSFKSIMYDVSQLILCSILIPIGATLISVPLWFFSILARYTFFNN